MKVFGPGENGLNHDTGGWIDIAPAAIALEWGKSVREIPDALEAERNNDGTPAIDEATAIVFGHIEERIGCDGRLRMLRAPSPGKGL